MTLWTASYIALWVVVAALAVIAMGLLRQLGLIQMRLGVDPGVLITEEGLDRGTAAPDFEALDVQSRKIVRRAEYLGKRLVLIFMSPGCLACRELVPHINTMADGGKYHAEFVVVCHGILSSCEQFVRRYKLHTPLLVDPMNDIAAQYGITATPFAFLIDEEGVILIRGIVNTWPHLEALLREEGTIQTRTAPWKAGARGESDQWQHLPLVAGASGGEKSAEERKHG